MTRPLPPTMLWESTDPEVALSIRFQFATPEAATHWLINTVAYTYGIAVTSVDRLVISSANLLAWLTSAAGPLLAKCCGFAPAHQRLLNTGELVVWLAQARLPVSAPLVATTGSVQVRCDHLSLGVQRVISGDLLDPTQLDQAHAAGVTLAQLHQALAAYPRTTDFATHTQVPTVTALIDRWATQKLATITEPLLVAGSRTLLQHIQEGDSGPLPIQLVHGDYRAANILWHEDQIKAVLDFEEVRWGQRVNDLAWAAVHLGTRFHHWGPVTPAVHRAFLSSYITQNPLAVQEQAWLLPLLTWHSLVLACSAEGGPTYAAGLDVVKFYTSLLQSKTELAL